MYCVLTNHAVLHNLIRETKAGQRNARERRDSRQVSQGEPEGLVHVIVKKKQASSLKLLIWIWNL